MSWLFSRALVAEYSADASSAGEPSAPSRLTRSPLAYYAPAKTTDFSLPSQYGAVYAPLTDACGAALLMWYLAGFPARTSPPLAAVPVSPVRVAASGRSSRASFARWNRRSCSWKIRPCSLRAGSTPSSVIWPRWGSMRNGACWERTRSVPRIAESAFGFWVPTPTASAGRFAEIKGCHILASTFGCMKHSMTRWLLAQHGKSVSPGIQVFLMGWPHGWTSLKPLATAKFRRWLRQHGASSSLASSREA